MASPVDEGGVGDDGEGGAPGASRRRVLARVLASAAVVAVLVVAAFAAVQTLNRGSMYFQEGLMCQPCWDQLKDIEQNWDEFEALGIDTLITVTTDPIEPLRQKVELEGLRSPVLSDRDVAVSKRYTTNEYGMMGDSYNGHSFIVVDPDGTIMWRADYGGAPKYTMYLPVDVLLADLRAGVDET